MLILKTDPSVSVGIFALAFARPAAPVIKTFTRRESKARLERDQEEDVLKSYSTTKDAKSTKVRNINVRILRDLRALRGEDIN